MCVCVCVYTCKRMCLFFWMWTIWSLLNLLQYCFSFIIYLFIYFYYKACRILAPLAGIELVPPALEGEVLTPGKSPYVVF